MDADLSHVVAALADLNDGELAALIEATNKVPPALPAYFPLAVVEAAYKRAASTAPSAKLCQPAVTFDFPRLQREQSV